MWYLPLILLVCVALHQRWRVRYLGQSSWLGGGFAMFSEMRPHRLITELWFQGKNGKLTSLQATVQNDNPLLRMVEAIPTRAHLEVWAKSVFETAWQQCGEIAHVPFRIQVIDPLPVSKVTLRLRKMEFDGIAGIHRGIDLQEYSFDGKDGAIQVRT
jgi:hypothetical protein